VCFSAEASFAAAALLVPTGAIGIRRAYQSDRRYLAFAALPVYFGLQQLFEGLVWTGGRVGNEVWIENFSLGYMFFSWLAWPVWVPFSTYFMEPCKRRHVYLMFSIIGAAVGALQYFPYFAHERWLVTRFLEHAISYEGTILFDFIMRREMTNALYLFVVISPLVSSSNPSARTFGYLMIAVVIAVYLFFRFAYISAFCMGGALMSTYILYTVFRPPALEVRAA